MRIPGILQGVVDMRNRRVEPEFPRNSAAHALLSGEDSVSDGGRTRDSTLGGTGGGFVLLTFPALVRVAVGTG